MHEGAIKDGGVSIQPWQIPKLGSGIGTSSAGGGVRWENTNPVPPAQGAWAQTGVSAGFAQGNWAGKLPPSEHRGIYGGNWGIRTGGNA